MILLNYAHPLTPDQLAMIAELAGAAPDVRDIPVQADRARAIAEVARELADAARVSAHEWQTLPLLVNPPGLAPLALALIAEVHGRCGHFPAVLVIRPLVGSISPSYEVAEIVNLQILRDTARRQRSS